MRISATQLSETGRMDTLNTAPQLSELRQRVDHLLDRIAGNTRLTTAGLSTLDPSAVPSGYRVICLRRLRTSF
ncbi:hypothetical protein ACFVXE_11805 [Streptomyces sp. NPDC058231]|uniref:hypothetical protein n=1 Tax=Streptomyces sp. NPDC058231 TaxID=3346392 RepID=UPI0036EE680B